MKKNNQYSKAILFGVLTGVVVIIGGIVIYNLTKESLKIAKEIEGNTKAADAYEQRLADLDELKRNYEALQTVEPDANKLISDAIPSTLGYPRYIIALKNIAQSQTGYDSLALNDATSIAPGQGYSTATVSMNFAASWDRLLALLDRLQHGSRLTDISSISLSGKGVLTASMKAEIYFQTDERERAKE